MSQEEIEETKEQSVAEKKEIEEQKKTTTFCPKCDEPPKPKNPEKNKAQGTRHDDYYSNQKK